ncbi:VOC family protein [Mycobacterium sp. M1]|uniref:VOC family protein n=1 Tax=Mycolicibacter acidiphilus TaxID=2835306 RepID=A0ABS5RGA8_9MYCO|nr:VOC family protein [Mycolicibacter acidiphilus]MBS9532674.1 VOC family protein [Mycolicibacter acidiphilus]
MTPPTRTPVQIAWVTDDLAATETVLSALLGARKWVRLPGVHFGPDTCEYRGEPADFTADISLSYAGDTQLELIAPVEGESIYTEFLAAGGPGLHHVCVETDDLDATLADAVAGGAEVVQCGVLSGMRFGYVSAVQAGVPFIEFACVGSQIRDFFDYVKREQQ